MGGKAGALTLKQTFPFCPLISVGRYGVENFPGGNKTRGRDFKSLTLMARMMIILPICGLETGG